MCQFREATFKCICIPNARKVSTQRRWGMKLNVSPATEHMDRRTVLKVLKVFGHVQKLGGKLTMYQAQIFSANIRTFLYV